MPGAVAEQKGKTRLEEALQASEHDADPSTYLLADNTNLRYGNNGMSREEVNKKSVGSDDTTPLNFEADEPQPLNVFLTPRILKTLMVYMVLTFVNTSCNVLLPLVYSTSIPIGGLGLDAYHIGMILSILGFTKAIIQVMFLGKLVRRFGARMTFLVCLLSYLGHVGLYLLLNPLARQAGRVDRKVWGVIVAQLVFRLTNSLAFGE